MRSHWLLGSLLILPAIAGCSGSGNNKADAFIVTVDGKPDAPPPPPGCDYGELNDEFNDDAVNTGSPEMTNVTFNGTS